MVATGPVTAVGFPAGVGALADLAPVHDEAGLGWLVLDGDGVISRWDLAEGAATAVATASAPRGAGSPGVVRA